MHIQEAYWHYNKVKAEDLANDLEVVDFGRGLSEEQKKVLLPVGKISAEAIGKACTAFRDFGKDAVSSEDKPAVVATEAIVYEHQEFPGK
jgi:alkylated DNA repair protein alkB family protein 1